MNQELRCAQHRAPAGWRCTACAALLCPDCTALRETPPVQLVACTLCRGLAEPIRRHRRELGSLLSRLPRALLWPLSGEGLVAWLAGALLLTLGSYAGLLQLVAWAGLVSALFAVVRMTGRGADHFDLDELTDLFSLLTPVARLALAMLPIWLPATVYFLLAHPVHPWVIDSLVGLGLLWLPMAFIAAATGTSPVTMLNPLAIYGSAMVVGRDYGLYLLAWFSLVVLGVPLSLLAAVLLALPIPFFSTFAAALLLLYLPYVGARVAGLVLYLHGDELGWGTREEYLEPLLGATPPRATLPDAVQLLETQEMKKKFAPIELAPEPVPLPLDAAPQLRAPPQPLDASALPSLEEQLLEQARHAIRERDLGAALEVWKASSAGLSLTCAELTYLGQGAASKSDAELALSLLTRAAESEAAPAELARARVLVARVLEERLQRPADARTWMERVVSEQAGTEGASYARQWLAKTR